MKKLFAILAASVFASSAFAIGLGNDNPGGTGIATATQGQNQGQAQDQLQGQGQAQFTNVAVSNRISNDEPCQCSIVRCRWQRIRRWR